MQLDPRIIRQSIENLKLQHPELQDDDESWAMSLESETEINSFLTNIVRKIEDAKSLVIGTQDRFEELKSRKSRFEARIEALRDLLFKTMETAELSSKELPEATLSIRAVPPTVVIHDESLLPDWACKFERKPDKARIKQALAERDVEGASMSNGGKTISIRIK